MQLCSLFLRDSISAPVQEDYPIMNSHTSLTIVTNQERSSAATPPQCDGIFIIFKSAMEAGHFDSSDDEDAPTGKSRRRGCITQRTTWCSRNWMLRLSASFYVKLNNLVESIVVLSEQSVTDIHLSLEHQVQVSGKQHPTSFWRKMGKTEYKDKVIAAFAGSNPRIEGSISDVLISPLSHSPQPRQAELARYEQAAMIRSPGGIVPYSPPAPKSVPQGLALLAHGTSSQEQMYIHEVLSDPSRFGE